MSTTADNPEVTKHRIMKAAKLANWLIKIGDDARTVSNLHDSEWAQASTEADVNYPSASSKLLTVALVHAYRSGEQQTGLTQMPDES